MRVQRTSYGSILAVVLLISCVTNARADLVGLWRFDNNVSPQPDASGNGGDASVENDATWVNDLERGGVMEFEGPGTDQHLLVEDSDALSVEGPVTIAAWANFATFDTWNGIVTKGGVVHSNYPAPYDVYTNQNGDGRVQFYAGGDDAIAQVFSDVAPELETWQHIAVTWDEEGEVVHYLNGEVNGIGFIDMEATPPVDADQPLYIGARQDFVTNMTGRLDDVAIFNEALSETDILAVMGGDFSKWIGGGVPGDFDGNGVLDEKDVNLLTMEINTGTGNKQYDVNGDGNVDTADHTMWVKELKKTWFGDANFDKEFNSTDLVQVLAAGKYEDTIDKNAGWEEGDWNADQDFNSADLITGLADGGYEQGVFPDGAAVVPEPASAGMLMLGLLYLLTRRRYSRL
jgi:hypothetical protein